MKKTLFTLFILLFAASIVVAQTQTQAQPKAQAKPAHKIFKGTIDAVTLADAANGTKPELTLVNAQKKKITFLVKSTTTISDADGKPLTLDKLQTGEKCRVSYGTTPENINEAVSIHLLK